MKVVFNVSDSGSIFSPEREALKKALRSIKNDNDFDGLSRYYGQNRFSELFDRQLPNSFINWSKSRCGKTSASTYWAGGGSFNTNTITGNVICGAELREKTYLIGGLSLYNGNDIISESLHKKPEIGSFKHYINELFEVINIYREALNKIIENHYEIKEKTNKRIQKLLRALIRILEHNTARITRFATDGLHLIEPLIRSALHYLVNISKIEKVSGLPGSHPICNSLTFQPCQNYPYPI